MKLTVLGSGIGLSDANRACSGYLIESGQNALVFDLGSGAFRNLKQAIAPNKVSALFFSHYNHVDHVGDLTAFLWQRKMFSEKNPSEARQLHLFGPRGFEAFVKKVFEAFPALAEVKYPIKVEELQYVSKKVFDFTVKTKPVAHFDNCLGFRIECNEKAIAYSGDSELCDELFDLGNEADLFVLDCSFPGTAKHNLHLNASECGELGRKTKAKRILLSHLFPESEHADLKAEAAKNYSGEILVAKDLLAVEV